MFPSKAKPATEETFTDAHLILALAICRPGLVPAIVIGIFLPCIKPGLVARSGTMIIIRNLGLFSFIMARINVSPCFTLEAFFSAVQSTAIAFIISNFAIAGEIIIPKSPKVKHDSFSLPRFLQLLYGSFLHKGSSHSRTLLHYMVKKRNRGRNHLGKENRRQMVDKDVIWLLTMEENLHTLQKYHHCQKTKSDNLLP